MYATGFASTITFMFLQRAVFRCHQSAAECRRNFRVQNITEMAQWTLLAELNTAIHGPPDPLTGIEWAACPLCNRKEKWRMKEKDVEEKRGNRKMGNERKVKDGDRREGKERRLGSYLTKS